MKRVGIVGCGGIASTHAWALNQIKNVTIAGTADIDYSKAQKLSEEYAGSHPYDSLSEMLKQEQPDILHICTPHHLHVPMAIQALSLGISVFMEKPPAISPEQFRQLQEMDESTSASLGFCFQNRYNATTGQVDSIINSGQLGHLLGARAFVTWRRDSDYYKDSWKGHPEYEGGGALMNQSIHTLDLMLRYFDTPLTVEASIHNHHLKKQIEVEDTVEAWMEFAGGKRACFYASNAYITDAPNILDFHLEKGRISIIDHTVTIQENGKDTIYIHCEEQPGIGKGYWGNGHLSCIQDFYNSLETGSTFQNNLAGVSNTIETVMKIYDSGRNQKGQP